MKEILHGVKEERNILLKMKRRKAKEVCHILCRNCLIKQVIARNIEERIEGWEDEEEDVSSYRMSLRKREGTGN
jgi:hypothetical protein